MKKENLFIIILAMILSVSCKEYAEPETFLIPESYTGAVVVVFDQKDGAPKEHKGGRRIYRIPEHGILYTQFLPVTGILDERFYYVNEEGGKLNELTRITFEKKPKEQVNYILDQYDGGFSDLPKEGITKGSSADYPTVEWIYFTIGKPSESKDSLRGIANSLIDKIAKVYPKQVMR